MSTRDRLTRLRAATTWRVGAVVLAVLALLALSGERALDWREQQDRASEEEAAVAAATEEVQGLVAISGATSAEAMERLLDGATAEFRSELEAQADRLQKALVDNEVDATGEVVSAGVVELSDDEATVIVAAAGTVSNKQTKEAEPRNYRLRVDLARTEDRWLVSGLEFVA